MNKYSDITEQLLGIAKNDSSLKAIVAIGSSTRENVKADEFSDLDLMIVTEDPDGWISGNLPSRLGEISISFVEPTLGGGMERRVFFSEYRDCDMLVYTPTQFVEMVNKGEASWVMNRGYCVLYDDMNVTSLLNEKISLELHPTNLSQEEFNNTINNFYFHIIWTAKKIKRGELWSAKMVMDGHMKALLLKVIEMYCYLKYGADTWHDGRFMEVWADESIKADLCGCFAKYDEKEMSPALMASEKLFTRLAKEIAVMKGWQFDQKARDYGAGYLE